MRKKLQLLTLMAALLLGVFNVNAQDNGIITGQTRSGSYVIMLEEMAVPYDVSNNGQHVAIQSFEAGTSYYWSSTGGLDTIAGMAYSVTDDGKVAGTFVNNAGISMAGYWMPSTQTWTPLPTNPAYPNVNASTEYNSLWCMNNAGDTYAVMHMDANFNAFPYTYNETSGFQALPCTGYTGGRPNSISDNGDVVAGFVISDFGFWIPAFWADNQLTVIDDFVGEATAVSANGRYVAGFTEDATSRSFIYDRNNSTTTIVPDLSGTTDGLHATCITNDGDVFGYINAFPPFYRTAFACTRGAYLSFADYLAMRGFTEAASWTIQAVYSVSADGNTFVGAATSADGATSFSFIVTLDPLPECGAPENLTATIDEDVYTTINLNWDAPADPVGVTYDIYASVLDETPLVSGVAATQYSFTDNQPGERSFIVKAVWPDGCVSVPSNNATVTVYSCPADAMCSLTFIVNDEYGDGWNGASIKITSTQGGEVNYVELSDPVEQATIELPLCSDELSFEWISGDYDEECSFSILFGDSTLYTSTDPITTGVFFTYTLDCPNADVAIDEYENQNVVIYPNPADNYINIVAENIEMVSVYNSVGQLMQTIAADGKNVTVNTADYNSGIYFIQVVANGVSSTQKVIVR